MRKGKNPLKWQGAEALAAAGLCQGKLPGRLGGSPYFYRARSEITPWFLFTPHLKWGAVSVSGYLGLSFAGIDDFVVGPAKTDTGPPFVIHTANFPGQLAPYISPDEAERGAFAKWAALIDDCLRQYPTSAQELAVQLHDGRLGGFRAAQQINASPPNEALAAWLGDRGIALPPESPLPIEAVSSSPATVQ